MTEHLTVSVADGVATISLNRPDKRNAMSHEMWVALGQHSHELAKDPAVRVLVVRGAGEHFCAGADIGGLQAADPAYGMANDEAQNGLAEFPKPTIAFIRGVCLGGGIQIAVSCDLRIADTTARVGITPARLGIMYPARSVERVVQLIGPSAAKHLLFSAEHIDAERALRIGLVDEVHEPDAAEARLAAFTATLATERSQLTQQASKAMIDAVMAEGHVSDEVVDHWAAAMATSEDAKEGVAAFLERRAPRFTWNG